MSIQRSALTLGPGKITRDGATIYSQGDITLEIETETIPVESSVHGKVDEITVDVAARIRYTPMGLWTNLAALWPYQTPDIGSRIFGDADVPTTIQTKDGQLYTLVNTAVTGMPEITLSASKFAWGQHEITGLRKLASDWSTADSLMTIGASPWTWTNDFDQANLKKGPFSAVWAGKTGFDTGFSTQDGWTITPELRLGEVPSDDIGSADMVLESLGVMARCIPIGPTAAQILAASLFQGENAARGAIMSAQGADLTITRTGQSATLKNAALKRTGYAFGSRTLRNGEIGFVATQLFDGVSNAPDPLIVLA